MVVDVTKTHAVTKIVGDKCFIAITIRGYTMYGSVIPFRNRMFPLNIDEVPQEIVVKSELTAAGIEIIPKPSCNQGTQTESQAQPEIGLLGSIMGGMQLAKAHLGIATPSATTVEQRKAICEGCSKNDLGRCSSCGCYLWAKIRAKNDKCPIGKW